MFEGRLMAIIVCPQAGAPLEEVPEVEAIAGRGLAGDRYSAGRGAGQRRGPEQNKAITLIEREAIEAAARDYDLRIVHRITRRNLLTEGVPLNHLVGREFVVGEATLSLPLEGLIDFGAERARLKKELARLADEVGKIDQKLGNPQFVERAPEEVIETQRERRAEAEALREKVSAALARVGG